MAKPTPIPLTRAHRQAAIAKIHLGKKQLGLDDDSYRALLANYGGADSSAKLDAKGMDAVLARMQALGCVFTAPKRAGKKPRASQDRQAQINKIEALLAERGLPWGYLTEQQTGKDGKPRPSMLFRLTAVARLEWCNGSQLNKVIAALAIQQQRAAKK